jgi:NAD(P)-dependent dehydrogenase (short-subunit alcohol dehydrogenase family)
VGSSSRAVRSALVVGGGSGIGLALVERYRDGGVPVVVWDVAGERDVDCDITDPQQVDDAIAATTERLGDLGVATEVTLCAGVGQAGLLLDSNPDDFDRVMSVNAKGAWLAMRGAARLLVDSDTPGSIVAVSSVSSRLVDRNMGLYCASKAALDMIVKVAAFEWARAAIRVNAVAPGVTRTPMLGPATPGSGWLGAIEARTPMGRLGEAGEVADAVLALHRLDWVTGQVLDCDGGLSLYSPIDSYGYQLGRRSE